jgi:uncharacterized protein YyaL (SSP411 family)
MSFVQATTGSGGWPMTVFLTPELKPFFGGTYFPPASKWGRPGFSDLLGELARVWQHERTRVEEAASELLQRLRAVTATGGSSGAESELASPEALDVAVDQFQRSFDRRRGGFGDAPKFPRPSELLFLLREHARRGSNDVRSTYASQMATETLRAMALGGMRDHIGGGFHRYSVDGEWRVPHFEKMLYDQSQLVLAYLEAAQATGDAFYATVAEDTLEYVRRDMTDPEGGFYSAEDADSVPPEHATDPNVRKSEGAFYIWADEEIAAVLGEDADIARRRFGIEPGGNAPHDPQGEFTGKNLLYTSQSIEEISIRSGKTVDEVVAALGRIRQRLMTARSTRPRPHLDDKVLTAWNGLMIAAFARAARVLVDRPLASEYLACARRAASFVRAKLCTDTGLLRRYRDGEAAISAYAEDYAFLIWGLLELFHSSGDATWLEWALSLQAEQDQKFWDENEAGWFSTSGDDPTVLLRLKEDYDGAEPAASSVSALNTLTIANLTGDERMRERAERTIARYGPRIGAAARSIPMMLCALSAWHAGYSQIAIVGDDDAARPLKMELARHYLPFALNVPVSTTAPRENLSRLLPFTAAMIARDGAAAYVCRNFTCRQPVTTAQDLAREIG